MNMIWTREGRGNYAPLITMIARRYYRVLRGNGEWIVETSDNREDWTLSTTQRTQRDAKAWVGQQA